MASDSEVSICNGALLILGAKPIGSLDDNTDNARLCNQFYSSTRNTALQAYPWNFAVRRATLTQDATAPAYGFTYQYDLPNSPDYCLRVLRAQDPRIVFRVEGRKLLTDEGSINIKYISRITSAAQFSPLFREALEYLLAWKLCYAVTGSTSLRKDLMQSYESILVEAEDIDTQEGVNDPDEEYGEFNDIVDARVNGTSIGRSNR
jgi:hypothetical protein